MLVRTQEEILQRIKEVQEQGDDFFGVIVSDLVDQLDYENAKPFLREGVTKEEWDAERKDPLDHLKEYMPFALGKAENHRGISASRSIEHMKTWLWLMGNDSLLAFAEEDNNYKYYGVPILDAICREYGIEMPDEEWFVNMSNGEPCFPGCTECG